MTHHFLAVALAALVASSACSNPDKERLKQTTVPTYDKETGKLKELTFDSNKNGKVDTWTQMDGAKPVLTRMDRDEDGKLDRWEYYDGNAKLVKVGFSRANTGRPDAWAYSGATLEQIDRVEISSSGDEKKIDRWERYGPGNVLIAADEDTDGDGKPDKWETYADGAVRSVAFDETKDGHPDRQMSYQKGALVLIETQPDQYGKYTKIVKVQQ